MAKESKKKNKKKESNIKVFFRIVKDAYCGKDKKDSEYTDKTISILSSLLFYTIGVCMLLFDLILFICTLIYYINMHDWTNIIGGILGIFFLCPIMFAVFILATLMFGTAREQENAKGEKSVVIFSAMVSFVALIIAAIALFK